MIRRLALVGCAVLAAATLSSCSTFSNNEAVVRVGDHELDQPALQGMLESRVGSDTLRESVVDGKISAVGARSLIAAWIVLVAIEDSGVLTDEGIAAATTETAANYADSWADTPAEMQHLAILNRAVGALIDEGSVPREILLQSVLDAKVYVDPFYGYFDSTSASVLPLGPQTPAP